MSLEPALDPVRISIAQAIVDALAYSDVFDYPMTSGQILRYLVGTPASRAEVDAALECDRWLCERIEREGELFCLAGRSATFSLRNERAAHSAALWDQARVLARIVALLPFVRMVAVIGSLTMDNARSRADDIDIFVVTAAGRVWLTRSLIILLVRAARLRRVDLCPNYIVSERKLRMESEDLFTAREIAQMRPLWGREAFGALVDANRWVAATLPNATLCSDDVADLSPRRRGLQTAFELPLRGFLGDVIERRLRARKLAQLAGQARTIGSREVVLEPEVCKGHMDSHGQKIRQEYALRRDRYLASAPEATWRE